MKTYFQIICLLGLSILLGCQQETEYTLYVSPEGSDEHDGSLAQPLASVKAAIMEATQLIRKGQPATIVLQEGTHYLQEAIVLSPSLSGTESAPLTIRGEAGKRVAVSGGRPLKLSWKKFRDGIYRAELAGFSFDQLFINGEKQVRARYPNYDETVKIFNGYAADANAPERAATWSRPEGGFLHAIHKHRWGAYHYRIKGVKEDGSLEIEGGWQNNRQLGMHDQYRFVENIFEELDTPGEWYQDTRKGQLYYFPKPGEELDSAKVEIALLDHLFEFRGSEENPVRYIQLEGLEFVHTRYTFMETREPLLRSDWAIYRGGAILFEGAEHCAVQDCYFNGLGGNGVFVSNYNRNVSVRGCEMTRLGASGVCFVGSADAVRSPSFEYGEFVPPSDLDQTPGPKNNNYPANCSVEDCLIYDIGRLEKQVAGVQISMASEITVSHNSIYQVPRAGINISEGTWGGHLIANNDVFQTVLETGDHGAFNSWGRDRFWHPGRKVMDSLVKAAPSLIKLDAIKPTVIRNNRFRCDHGWDIDLDDGSSNYHIYNNLCLNGGIKLREGFYRTVENNIMVNNSFHPHVWFENSGDVFRHNIVMSAYKDILLNGWGKKIDYNLFPDSLALQQAQANGVDEHSIYGKPQFVAPEKGNFKVQKDSPALDIGFENFPMDSFGVVSPRLKEKAKTPEIPPLHIRQYGQGKEQMASWLGAQIKAVSGEAEVSAAGLAKAAGVWVLEVESKSPAAEAGLQAKDIIVQVFDDEISGLSSLMSAQQGHNWKGFLRLTVIRNQQQKTIDISLEKS